MNVQKRVNEQWRSIRPQLAKVPQLGKVLSINSGQPAADIAVMPTRAGSDGLLREIDHVAIAVRDIDAAVKWYEEAFGAEVVHREYVERDKIEEVLLAVSDSYIQLLTPVSDDSPVARFLEQRGEGLHHVGFRVKDVASAIDSVKATGAKMIDNEPRPGSRGTTIAFVHPKAAFGTLVELVEE